MSHCRHCDVVKSGSKIFEDEKVVAILDQNPVSVGHVVVMPKEHFPIIEQVPDYVVSHVFEIVNKISMHLFEALKLQGTNILVNNGMPAGQEQPHFSVDVIPRKENDGIDFQWEPKQLSQEEMSTVELELKNNTGAVGEFEQEKTAPIKQEKAKTISSDKDSYLIKQLRRIP